MAKGGKVEQEKNNEKEKKKNQIEQSSIVPLV